METTLKRALFSKKKTLSRNIRVVSPYPITHRLGVEKDFVGKSILELMSVKFPFLPKAEWKRRIETGRVYVNTSIVEPGLLLSNSDEVFHHNPNVIEPSVPDEVEVLKETEDYLIVFKPAPMPMHPGGRYFKNSLTEILKKKGYEDLRITHRLDAVTLGVVLIARTKEFAKKAIQSFAKGSVSKTYFAKVDGTPLEESMTINAPIKRKHGFVFECEDGLEGGKPAITHFKVVETLNESSLIKCIPETGRTHQIRLHLLKWGHPIIDDLIYGRKGDQSSKTTQNRGISLISTGLEIEELGVNYQLMEEY